MHEWLAHIGLAGRHLSGGVFRQQKGDVELDCPDHWGNHALRCPQQGAARPVGLAAGDSGGCGNCLPHLPQVQPVLTDNHLVGD